MKKLYLLIFFICLIEAKNISKPQKLKVDSFETKVNKIIDPWMQQHKIPGVAIAVYDHGKSYLFHYGYADQQKTKAVTENTVFEIGSVSKVFTCLLVAQEILAGTMRLSDPINIYIPELKNNKWLQKTTIEKLSTHTSTMPFDAPAWVVSDSTFYTFMKNWRPSHPQELWFQYSNPGIELLRIALEKLHHTTINDLIIKRILLPLNMSPISMNVPKQYMPHYTFCYNKKGEPARYWDDGILLGSGAIRASNADMLKFLKAAVGVSGTPASILKAMQFTQRPYIAVSNMYHGLGWEIKNIGNLVCKDSIFWGFPAKKIIESENVSSNNLIFEKTGTTCGFHAYIGVIPAQKKGIVIMINRALPFGFGIIKKMGRKIMFELTH